jgi:hypothetical protein
VNHRDVKKRLLETKDLLAAAAKMDVDRRKAKPKDGKIKDEMEVDIQAVNDDDDPAAKLSKALNPSRVRGMFNRPKEDLLNRVYEESQVAEEERADMNRLEEVWGEDVCIMAAPEEIRLALTGTRLPVSHIPFQSHYVPTDY